MPNIKSSKKDVISSKIAYENNKANKSELKTALKKFDAALVAGDKTVAEHGRDCAHAPAARLPPRRG